METNNDLEEVAAELQVLLQLPHQQYTLKQLHEALADRMNNLIVNDFSLLISILYKLDISEKKLQQLLAQSNDETAGSMMAALIIERQLQKRAAREAFKNDPANIPEDEKW